MSAPIIPGKPCDTEIGFGTRGQRDWANDVVNQWNDDGISPHPLDRDHGDFRREIMRGWVHRTLSQDQIDKGIRDIHIAAWPSSYLG